MHAINMKGYPIKSSGSNSLAIERPSRSYTRTSTFRFRDGSLWQLTVPCTQTHLCSASTATNDMANIHTHAAIIFCKKYHESNMEDMATTANISTELIKQSLTHMLRIMTSLCKSEQLFWYSLINKHCFSTVPFIPLFF